MRGSVPLADISPGSDRSRTCPSTIGIGAGQAAYYRLEYHQVGTEVNSVKNDGPELIEAAPANKP
jgi:hypothetical protein